MDVQDVGPQKVSSSDSSVTEWSIGQHWLVPESWTSGPEKTLLLSDSLITVMIVIKRPMSDRGNTSLLPEFEASLRSPSSGILLRMLAERHHNLIFGMNIKVDASRGSVLI